MTGREWLSDSTLEGVVRRLVGLGLLWGVAWAVGFAARGELEALPSLTVLVALSIFQLRSLRAQVSRFDPRGASFGARSFFFTLGRYAALGLVLVALLRYGPRGHALALAAGAGTLPIVLIVEAVLGAVRSSRTPADAADHYSEASREEREPHP